MSRFRFFNTVEPVTEIYRNLLPDLSERGHKVTAIISRAEYRQGRRPLESAVNAQGVTIKRTVSAPRSVTEGRIGKFLKAALYALHASIGAVLSRGFDSNVFFTQPPLFFVLGRFLRAVHGQRLVLVLMDIYPDVLFASGILREQSWAGRFLSRIARAVWRSADRIIVIGRCMEAKVAETGVDSSKIRVIPNWVDTEKVRPVAHHDNPLRRELGLTDEFVVLYSGNMGQAHDFETILWCAAELAEEPRIQFVFIGAGLRRASVEGQIHSLGLPNVKLFDPFPEDQLQFSFGLGDIHFVSLRPQFTGLMVPSKTYGAFAAGRPVLYEGDQDGEIGRLIREYDIGAVIQPAEKTSMQRVLLNYLDRPSLAQEQGARARRVAEETLSRSVSVSAYIDALEH